jgi:hypothetical protein
VAYHGVEKPEGTCPSGGFWGGCTVAAPTSLSPVFSYKCKGREQKRGGRKGEGSEDRKKKEEKKQTERRGRQLKETERKGRKIGEKKKKTEE